jgi:arginase
MSQKVRIFGVPMDLGQSRRGVDMGPSAIRCAGLQERLKSLGYDPYDNGNVVVPQVEEVEIVPVTEPGQGKARHLLEVTKGCTAIYERASKTLREGERAIFLGGDHSISMGTVAAMAEREDIGVLWIDAHADMNTPQTTPSGNVHGMPLAALMGDGAPELTGIGKKKLRPDQVGLIGLRSLDTAERTRITNIGVSAYTMRDIDERGIAALAHELLERFAGFKHLHISLDMDSLDPSFAPGVGTPVPGGLTYREAHLLMEILADTNKVRSLDIVEVNPVLDERNRTAELAVELAASLFGQRIL